MSLPIDQDKLNQGQGQGQLNRRHEAITTVRAIIYAISILELRQSDLFASLATLSHFQLLVKYPCQDSSVVSANSAHRDGFTRSLRGCGGGECRGLAVKLNYALLARVS